MKKNTIATNNINEISTTSLISLHLLPAAIWAIFYIPLAKIAHINGIPTMLVMYIVAAFTLLPFELGFLYYQGKRLNNRFSLKGVVLYRDKLSWWLYLVLGLISFIWIVVIIFGTSNIMNFLDANIFFWVPDWFELSRGSIEQNSPFIEYAMWSCGFIFIAILVPLAEELYFRGYLLPRLSRFGRWAPLINVSLFILYHFWQPYFLITGILAMFPLVFFVWWKRNVYLSIGVHIFLNTFGWTMDLLQRLNT